MTETIEHVPGLKNLRREQAPLHDLWPGIEARLKPRRQHTPWAPWAGLALAASLLLAVILPLRMQTDSSALPSPAAAAFGNYSRHSTYFAAQLKIVHGAEKDLLHALKQQPHSPALHRLLESTRQRQRELRRLITTYA